MISLYRPLLESAAALINWDPLLLEAQVFVESGDDRYAFRYEPDFFARYIRDNHGAVAHAYGPLAACSMGLLQVLYQVAREDGFTRADGTPGQPHDLFDPSTNVRVACRHLAVLRTQIPGGAVAAVLAAYNGGRGGNLTPPYRNAAYAEKVQNVREHLHA